MTNQKIKTFHLKEKLTGLSQNFWTYFNLKIDDNRARATW